MKFSQLKIGERFRYRGSSYVKTGPLQATGDGSSAAQMIMRAANVEPVDADGEPKRESASNLQRLRGAVSDYHESCCRILQEHCGAQAGQVGERLDAQYRQLIEALDRLERG
jgi:hypothetical protein